MRSVRSYAIIIYNELQTFDFHITLVIEVIEVQNHSNRFAEVIDDVQYLNC